MTRGALPAALALLPALAPTLAAAADPAAGEALGGDRPALAEAPAAAPMPWRLELKRVMTERGTPGERTKATVRVEKFLDAWVAQLRVDVPFVDKNNEFQSDPSNAGLGDLKCRVGLRPLRVGGVRLTANVDVTLPTADPGSLGGGKYQLGPGVEASIPLPTPWSAASPLLRFAPLVRQTFSVAGDADRADQSYTQLEAKLEASWPDRFAVSLTPKPVVDWEQGGKTAAVLELEAAWIVSRSFRLWVKPGLRLWGPALPCTYDRQLETGVRLTI